MKNLNENIINIIDEYIESESMKEYLKNHVDELSDRQIIDMIYGAEKSLEKKLLTIKNLYEIIAEESSHEIDEYIEAIKNISLASEECKAKDGEIFIVETIEYDERTKEQTTTNFEPFLSFNKIIFI